MISRLALAFVRQELTPECLSLLYSSAKTLLGVIVMSGRYIFVQHLGSFGFGSITVYLDTQLNRKVVRKVLRDSNFENF